MNKVGAISIDVAGLPPQAHRLDDVLTVICVAIANNVAVTRPSWPACVYAHVTSVTRAFVEKDANRSLQMRRLR